MDIFHGKCSPLKVQPASLKWLKNHSLLVFFFLATHLKKHMCSRQIDGLFPYFLRYSAENTNISPIGDMLVFSVMYTF